MIPNNTLINGDCLNILPLIDDNTVDLILTDLPYGTTKNKWDILIPLDKLWEQYKRILKNNGVVVLFGQGLFAYKLALSNEEWFKYDLVWKKGERVSGFLDAKKKPLRNHELLLVFYKNQPTYNPQFTEGKPLHGMGSKYKNGELNNNNYNKFNSHKNPSANRKGDTKKYPKSVLNFNRPHPPIHPTQKPIELCEWIIKTYTDEGNLVLDNTMGVGTTCIASNNTNRKYIGIEIDEKYFNISLNNLKQSNVLKI